MAPLVLFFQCTRFPVQIWDDVQSMLEETSPATRKVPENVRLEVFEQYMDSLRVSAKETGSAKMFNGLSLPPEVSGGVRTLFAEFLERYM